MLRLLLTLALLPLLPSCSQYTETQPYLVGTFVGYALTDPGATPVGLRLETTLGEVTKEHYAVTGTATLGTERHTVQGEEVSNTNLGYLAPQALPPMGHLKLTFRDQSGTSAYSLCAVVRYDNTFANTRYAFDGAELYRGECSVPPAPPSTGLVRFAEVFLEKQLPY